MNALQAIVLGLVQGLTEFLPVSSSGHLVIVQTLFNIDSNMLVFDVFVHIGTLVSVFVAFREDIWGIIKKPISHFTGLILVGCIPAAVMGLLLDDIFESLFSSIVAVAIALIITGFLLMISDRFNGKKTIDE
ncbi:MAG: undecaprenyl-diphosphate phosphatase, partial [Firmicutes bacterium]|nr:undecaprenyl-diphosphate phosphatase [Bacillota bacterium]